MLNSVEVCTCQCKMFTVIIFMRHSVGHTAFVNQHFCLFEAVNVTPIYSEVVIVLCRRKMPTQAWFCCRNGVSPVENVTG